MDAYFDSAIVVKLYVKEATSPEAIRLVGACLAPYVLTQWQVLEVKNAIRLKAFRQEITQAEALRSVSAFEQDISTGRWRRPAISATEVEQKAEELSSVHTAMVGCRTLDIIHVAAALALGAKVLVTFDARQGELASRVGLAVRP